ncbi:manganese efflux pump MntP family protein [Paenibacillus yanchengensis]|uniref:Putative manganese efflux pump MntP n=1 Tax=Paenibacillus yanchengensis TaxID=2035833 RepID=A0ABW4YNK7_9BACL
MKGWSRLEQLRFTWSDMVDIGAGSGGVLTLLIISLAIGMDAFSVGIGIGVRGIRLLHVLRLGLLVALFHLIMPLAGILMGRWMNELLGDIAVLAAGCLFLLLGVQMIYSAFRANTEPIFNHRSMWGMVVIAFSVSVDAFSVGVTLGVLPLKIWATVFLLGSIGGLMAMLGLLLGRKVSARLGEYGEICGGAILIGLGILLII